MGKGPGVRRKQSLLGTKECSGPPAVRLKGPRKGGRAWNQTYRASQDLRCFARGKG